MARSLTYSVNWEPSQPEFSSCLLCARCTAMVHLLDHRAQVSQQCPRVPAASTWEAEANSPLDPGTAWEHPTAGNPARADSAPTVLPTASPLLPLSWGLRTKSSLGPGFSNPGPRAAPVLEILRNGTSLPVLEGQSLCLVCVTHSNPPASLSWTGVAQTLIPAQSSEPGMLELPLVQKEHEGEFTCAAQNPLGAQRISLSLSVHSPPQMPRSSCSWEAEGLHCSCSSRAWPAPSLRWRLGEGLLEGNSSNASFQLHLCRSLLHIRPSFPTYLCIDTATHLHSYIYSQLRPQHGHVSHLTSSLTLVSLLI
ncbi:hypothetical protein U0070_023100 [Myodes glareolus]|uniref:Ig-like domain-containing protein n=1 Tax=Myodes glareolus TaxID=447135 RepID=A0AAW0HTL6_MYOGA